MNSRQVHEGVSFSRLSMVLMNGSFIELWAIWLAESPEFQNSEPFRSCICSLAEMPSHKGSSFREMIIIGTTGFSWALIIRVTWVGKPLYWAILSSQPQFTHYAWHRPCSSISWSVIAIGWIRIPWSLITLSYSLHVFYEIDTSQYWPITECVVLWESVHGIGFYYTFPFFWVNEECEIGRYRKSRPFQVQWSG